jgi:Rad3-related DNA helicase
VLILQFRSRIRRAQNSVVSQRSSGESATQSQIPYATADVFADCDHATALFDFARNVSLYLVKGLPDPHDEHYAYERAAIGAIPHFVSKTGGRALVFFTSHRMMDEATRVPAPWFVEQRITLLSQSSGRARSKVIEEFQQDVTSVLFGTDSFWQGVDVPGKPSRM